MTDHEQIPLSGLYAEYRGHTYPVVFTSTAWWGLPAPGLDPDEFPDAIEFLSNSRGEWVKMPKRALQRMIDRDVTTRWHGEVMSVVGPVWEGTVQLNYQGSPQRAKELGLNGDQYNGWDIRVPIEEVTVTEVTERDLPS